VYRQPVFQDANFIQPGHHAAEQVLWLYYRTGGNDLAIDDDCRRLSCELNVADWSYDERRIGCNSIIYACRAHLLQLEKGIPMSARQTTIRDALLTFRKDHNVASLLGALRTH
jgi:hypothetical protein